jgi:hypothetical protein
MLEVLGNTEFTFQMWSLFTLIVVALIFYANENVPMEVTSVATLVLLLLFFHFFPILDQNDNLNNHSFSLFLSTLLAKTKLNKDKHCYRSLMRDRFTGEPVSYRHFQDFKAVMLEHGYLHHEKGKVHEDEDAHFFQTDEEKKQGVKEYIYYSASKFLVSDKLVGFCNDNGINEQNISKQFIQLKPEIFIEARYPSKRARATKFKGRRVRKADLYLMAEAHTQQAVMREVNDFLFAQKLSGAVFNGLKRVYSDFTDDGSYQFDMGGRLYAFGEDNYQRLLGN